MAYCQHVDLLVVCCLQVLLLPSAFGRATCPFSPVFALQLKQQQHRSCLALYNSRLGLLRLEVKGVLGRM